MNVVYHDGTHTYMVDGRVVPSVTQILADQRLIDLTWYTPDGRERGTAVHKAIANQCRGALCFNNKELEPYLEAYNNFQKDCDWVPEIIEQSMGCRFYAGTPDQIGKLNKKPAVLDIKTGGITPAVALQLVAYEKLYEKPLKRFSLQLTETGRYILDEHKDKKDPYIWESAVSLWWWRKNRGLI
jgi:hypothetical protein